MSDFYPCSALTGGGTGALDAIDGAGLSDGDVAFVRVKDDATYGSAFLPYTLDVDSAEAESSPDVIAPDTNAGDKRWKLLGIITAAGLVRGPMQGGVKGNALSAAGAISADQCRGQIVYVSGAGIYTLPAASTVIEGGHVTIEVAAAVTVSLDPDAGDRIRLNGVALTDGNKITSDGTAGATVTLHRDSADGWTVVGGTLGWIDGGA